jgi:hypothetical protein
MAFLVLLEALSPVEPAVFMLREVFEFDYPDGASPLADASIGCFGKESADAETNTTTRPPGAWLNLGPPSHGSARPLGTSMDAEGHLGTAGDSRTHLPRAAGTL